MGGELKKFESESGAKRIPGNNSRGGEVSVRMTIVPENKET
jgi:hypothetical protein